MILKIDVIEEMFKAIGIVHGQQREFMWRNLLSTPIADIQRRQALHETQETEEAEKLISRCDA